MTKKQNTLVFILCGTVVSIIITLVLAIFFFVLTYLCLQNNEDLFSMVVPFTVVIALFLGMFLYQKLAMFVISHFTLEDKLDPLFKSKKKRNRLD